MWTPTTREQHSRKTLKLVMYESLCQWGERGYSVGC